MKNIKTIHIYNHVECKVCMNFQGQWYLYSGNFWLCLKPPKIFLIPSPLILEAYWLKSLWHFRWQEEKGACTVDSRARFYFWVLLFLQWLIHIFGLSFLIWKIRITPPTSCDCYIARIKWDLVGNVLIQYLTYIRGFINCTFFVNSSRTGQF